MMFLLWEGANLTAHGTNRDSRRRQVGRGAYPQEALEAVGTVPIGAAVGDGARGLQRRWHRMGVFSARPCAIKSVTLGRGWHWGHQRPASDDVFWLGDVERSRFYFERAAFWPDGQ